MLPYKFVTLLYFVLNFCSTQGLRFFKPRKKKKECLVREGWNFHYTTCSSKHQKCCETGCCDPSSSDVSLSYVRVFLVCALIAFIFMLVYIEMWCKKRCKWHKKGGRQPAPAGTTNVIGRNDEVEMQVSRLADDNDVASHRRLSDVSEVEEETYEDSSAHSSPPPPYHDQAGTLTLSSLV